jgi:hypothetical protein
LKYSSFVDSISYVSLETTDQYLVGSFGGMGELFSFSILESVNWKIKVFWVFKVLSKGNVLAM